MKDLLRSFEPKKRRKPLIEYTYASALNAMKNIYDVRLKMVRYAMEHGVSAAARHFATTRDTVRKWRDRYLESGASALMDQSRAPKYCPHRLSEQLEAKIIRIRIKQPYLGPYRIKSEHNIPASTGAIYRVLKSAGLTRGRRKKHHIKRDLREVKKQYRTFQKVQVDLKELRDIPRYYPFVLKGFPLYQFSARDVRSGLAYISYGYEKSATNAAIFLSYVCQHLKEIGVDLTQVEFQTDNGSEFVGSWNTKEQSAFEKVATQNGAQTSRIPPGQCTYNSDVEAFHKLIQDEFYEVQSYENLKDFLIKAFTYMLYFNYLRTFRYKAGNSPWQIYQSACFSRQPPRGDPMGRKRQLAKMKNAAVLMPIILDSKIHNFCQSEFQGGEKEIYSYLKGDDHVPKSDKNLKYIIIKKLLILPQW